jgi:hypothetical protein
MILYFGIYLQISYRINYKILLKVFSWITLVFKFSIICKLILIYSFLYIIIFLCTRIHIPIFVIFQKYFWKIDSLNNKNSDKDNFV